MVSVCIPCTFRFLSRSEFCVPGWFRCSPFLSRSARICFPLPFFRSRDFSALFPFCPASTFLLKHLQDVNFPSRVALSRPARLSSRFLLFLAASLAVFPVWFPFCFRVPLIIYPARNDRRFRRVFEIWRVFLARFSCFSFSRGTFCIKITLIFTPSRPVLSNPVPPTRLPALYYL